jgi:1,4-dihydroxy-2-naphthoate octaprenyltransferase
MHLRMNYYLTHSIFSLGISITLMFQGISRSLEDWYILVLGMIFFLMGAYQYVNYEIRYRALQRKYISEKL